MGIIYDGNFWTIDCKRLRNLVDIVRGRYKIYVVRSPLLQFPEYVGKFGNRYVLSALVVREFIVLTEYAP